MSYELKMDEQEDFLRFSISGERTRESVVAATIEILDICYDREFSSALIDAREFSGRLHHLDAYDVPAVEYPKLTRRGVVSRVAIVDLKDFSDSFRFFETVARNRGYNLRLFGDADEAAAWLRTGELPESADI